MFNRKILNYFFLPGLLLLLASCAVPIAETEPDIDEVQVYATVIRQVYTVDHTFGQPPNFPNIYLLKTNTLENGSSAQEGDAPTAAADDAIIEALSDLPAQFHLGDESGRRASGPLRHSGGWRCHKCRVNIRLECLQIGASPQKLDHPIR